MSAAAGGVLTATNRMPWRAWACLAASMALVGSYVGLSKWLVAVFPVFLLAGLRFGIAAVAMGGWTRRPADEPEQTRQDRGLLFLLSLLGNFLFSICMLFGVQLSTALAAGVDSRPPRPTITRPTPLAAAIFRMVCTATRLWKRPSPPTTSLWPASAPTCSGRMSNSAWTKFSR